jgi:hypothetical protein
MVFVIILLTLVVGLAVVALLINQQFHGAIVGMINKGKAYYAPRSREERVKLLREKIADSENKVKELEAAAKKQKEDQAEEAALKRQLVAAQKKEKMLGRR